MQAVSGGKSTACKISDTRSPPVSCRFTLLRDLPGNQTGFPENAVHMHKNIVKMSIGNGFAGDDHHIRGTGRIRSTNPDGFPQQPLDAVAPYGRPHVPGNRKAVSEAAGFGAHREYGKIRVRMFFPQRIHLTELNGVPEPFDPDWLTGTIDYTTRRLRPLARRLFNTSRPFRVLILLKKPCVLFRLIRLG